MAKVARMASRVYHFMVRFSFHGDCEGCGTRSSQAIEEFSSTPGLDISTCFLSVFYPVVFSPLYLLFFKAQMINLV